jgi:hypothetical protein
MSLHEHRHNWRALFFYGIVSVLVLAGGVAIVLSFLETQRLRSRIAAEPLPRVMVLTHDDSSRLAAAWVSTLTESGFKATLVSFENFRPVAGDLLAICSSAPIPPAAAAAVQSSLQQGRGVVVLGDFPAPLDRFRTTSMMSAGPVRLGQAVSPVLARIEPQHEIGTRDATVSVIEETPEMVVDARWGVSAKAAIAHWSADGGRMLWMGFDPGALHFAKDRQLSLLLRTALRWVDGQPVSDGASGAAASAKALEVTARIDARRKRLSYSVDRLNDKGSLAVRMVNKGKQPIENATIKIWLPPESKQCNVVRHFWKDRDVALANAGDEHAVTVTVPRLSPNEDRVLQLRASS